MSPVHARRLGQARHGLLPGEGQTYLRVLAVAGLIVGIVAMHSLGLGHGPMATGHTMSAGTAQMAGMNTPPAALAPHAPTPATVDVEAVAAGGLAHGMAAMCLAIVPFLVLLIVRMLGFRIRGVSPTARLLLAGGSIRNNRAPPAYRCPSLSKFCILRT